VANRKGKIKKALWVIEKGTSSTPLALLVFFPKLHFETSCCVK
jgi:hypothetical protein